MGCAQSPGGMARPSMPFSALRRKAGWAWALWEKKNAATWPCSGEKDRRFWAVEQDGEALGLLYLAPLAERGGGQWELGYALRQDEQGRGLATWACCLLLDQGFASGQVQRVNAFCRPDNRASRRLLRRLGFWKRERRLKNGCLSFDRWGRPCWQDALEYTMTAAAWQRRRGALPV